MDVLAKLRNTVSNTITNTVQNTAYGLSQLSSVLPGNPVTREFEATCQIASAGPGLLWKIYRGYKKSTKQEAAIFVFEKRLLEKWSSKQDRELILEMLKKGVAQLTKLRHPQILTVQHPLEESRDSLAFATEPVFGSLANALGLYENLPQPLPDGLKGYKLHDIEARYGLLQLGEGLAFLHGDVKMLHGNLCPETVVINVHGAWKIFGFDFCGLSKNTENKQPTWSYTEYDQSLPTVAQPHLDYQAPECLLASSIGPPSDIFALGMLAYVLHSPNNTPLHVSNGDLMRCRTFLESIKGSSLNLKLMSIPESLRDTVKLMLNHNPELRPDAHQFVKIEYFNDIGVRTLNYLDKIFQWDNLQKSQFYKGLPQLLKQLPHRVTLHRVLPALYKELVNPPMIPFVLPSILYAMEVSSIEEFQKFILPNLKPVLAMDDPPQISLVLMQHIDLLLKLCSADVIKTDVVPLLLRALESDFEQLQELCLSALPNIVTMIEGPAMKNAILPRIKKICLGKTNGAKSLGVRVNCLLCLAKMLPNFDRWLVFDQVLPFLQEIPHSGEPAMLMAIIGIYRMLLTHSKLDVSKEILATKILPFLLPLSIEQNFSLSQYETLSSLVMNMVQRVITEHKEALRQLDAVRRETQQLDQALSQTTSSICNQNSSLTDVTVSPTGAPPKSVQIENGLSIQEKFGLIQQREIHQRLQSQSPLTPKSAPQTFKPQPKDLTATLLQSNLDQLNLSSSSNLKSDFSWPSQNQFVNSPVSSAHKPNWNTNPTWNAMGSQNTSNFSPSSNLNTSGNDLHSFGINSKHNSSNFVQSPNFSVSSNMHNFGMNSNHSSSNLGQMIGQNISETSQNFGLNSGIGNTSHNSANFGMNLGYNSSNFGLNSTQSKIDNTSNLFLSGETNNGVNNSNRNSMSGSSNLLLNSSNSGSVSGAKNENSPAQDIMDLLS